MLPRVDSARDADSKTFGLFRLALSRYTEKDELASGSELPSVDLIFFFASLVVRGERGI